jgi:hypothetical protein
MRHVIWLGEHIGQRLAGTEEERKTIDFLEKVLGEYGVPVDILEFQGYISVPKSAELRIVEPENRTIECSCYAQVASTSPDGIVAELAYVGSGGLNDYKNLDTKGKITLAELSYSPPRPEKVRIAEKFGAVGQVQINWGGTALPLGTVKNIWGNPMPENIGSMPNIPAVGVRKADGEYLKAICAGGKARVWLKADCWRGWRRLSQVVAEIKGSVEHDRFVLVNGHFDAWGAASTCNATGNSLMLELARAMAKNRKQLRRGVRFAWWTGHETGIMVGSTFYVDNFWSDIRENCVAYMNCDSPGMKGTVYYSPTSTKEAERLHLDTIKEILGEEELKGGLAIETVFGRRPRKVGDQSVFGVGVPSLVGSTAYPLGMATLGEWYHSVDDTPDKVGLEPLAKAMKMYAALVLRICNARVLPFEFVSVADELIARLTDLQEEAKEVFDLSPLIERAKQLRARATKLDRISRKIALDFEKGRKSKKSEERADTINASLMKLSRILIPIDYTTVDKREQDTYGRTGLDKPIPLLNPVLDLAKMDRDTDEFKTLRTKLVRDRNKVLDGLDEANLLIENTLKAFS